MAMVAPMKSATRSSEVLMKPPTPVCGMITVAVNSIISFRAPTPKPAMIVKIDIDVQFLIGNFRKGFRRTNIMRVATPKPSMWTAWSYLRMWYGSPINGIRILAYRTEPLIIIPPPSMCRSPQILSPHRVKFG